MSTENNNLPIKETIYAMESKFNEVNIGNTLNFKKEAGFALQILNNNSYMLNAVMTDPECKRSLLEAVYNVALTNLSLNPVLKMAYLIPRKSKGKVKIVLDPSYQGLINAMVQSGNAKDVHASVVYEGDDFEMEWHIKKVTKHKPYFLVGKVRGKEIGVYACAILPDGSYKYEFLPMERVNSIMSRSEAVKNSPENNIWSGADREEMIKKTAVKALWKYMPKNERAIQVAEVIATDNDVNGIDFESERKEVAKSETQIKIGKAISDVVKKSKKKEIEAEEANVISEEPKGKPDIKEDLFD